MEINATEEMTAVDESPLHNRRDVDTGFWPVGWWKLLDFRIGIIPLPVYVLLVILIVGFAITGSVPSEISMFIAILAVGGFTCAELGRRLPILRNVGAAAIFATFIPSALAYYHLLPDPILTLVIDFTKFTNFLYLFIAAIIVGSILSMDRQVLIKGFVKIFVPLAIGSIVAGAVGTAIGVTLGLGAFHTFFFIVVPIMAGGVGEGAIPLSVGYAEIMHQPHGELFAQVLPPVMLGSLTAILFAGTLNFIGKRYPQLTGEGRLQPGEHDDMQPAQEEITGNMDVSTIAAAGIVASALSRRRHLSQPDRAPCPGRNALHCGYRQADECSVTTAATGSVCRLQILLDGGHLSVAVCHRPGVDAVGQADSSVQPSKSRHHRRHRSNFDGDRVHSRALPQHVSDRCGDRERLSQRAGRYRRRRYFDSG